MSRWLLFTACLLSLGAAAEPFTRGQRLLFWEGTLRGSPRLMGLSGAYVALAEGAEGMIRNPAAPAAKDPHFENELNVDVGGTMHFLFPGSTKEQDWDNDGRPEQTLGVPSVNLGTQVLYSALALQWKYFGFGLGVDTQNFATKVQNLFEDFDRYYNVNLLHLFASLAVNLWRDQILLGVGVETTHSFLLYGEQRAGERLPGYKASNGYHGWGIQLGGLWRPENQDYRVGVAFKPQVLGYPAGPTDDIGGYVPYAQVAVPGRLSIGGAVALGYGRHLNITSPLGWERPPPEYRRALAAVTAPQPPAPPPPQNPALQPLPAPPPGVATIDAGTLLPPASPGASTAAAPLPPAPPAPPPPVAQKPVELPPDPHPEDPGTAAMTKFLITAQLDVFFPVQNAVSMAAFLEQPNVEAIPAGDRVSFELRLGVEKEVFEDRLRLRVGGYLEPPINATGYLRPHVTFGGELYLFKLGRQRLSVGLSFDFASRYQNLSVAILTWK